MLRTPGKDTTEVRAYAFGDLVVRAGGGLVVSVRQRRTTTRTLPRLPHDYRAQAARMAGVEGLATR